MASLRDALSEAVTSTACTLLGTTGAYARNFEGILGAIAPGVGFPVASPASGLSAAYGLLCNRNPPPLQNPPPFTGGQCSGVLYDVSYSYDFRSGIATAPPGTVTPNAGTSRVTGKVNGVRANNTTFLAFGELLTDGGTINIGGGSSGFANNVRVENERITSIVRVGGLPDNCGDPTPPPVIPDPDPTGDNIDITYENDEGDTITNNFSITFGSAYIDINSQINIPVNIGNNNDTDFTINAALNFNTGDLNFYAGNPSYPPGTGTPGKDAYKPGTELPPKPPTVPSTDPPPFPDTSEAETEDIIAGCAVTVSEVPTNISVIFQSENPDIYAPNLGYVAFEIIVGTSTAWTSDIPVKNLRNLIPCEWPAGAIAVKGTPRPGVTWDLTPIYLTRTVVD